MRSPRRTLRQWINWLRCSETIELMNNKGVTAVIVTASGKPSGIFTERDVLKRVAIKELKVRKPQLNKS